MALLFPTPPDRLVDGRGRPYFLWDSEMTLDEFRAQLRSTDDEVRGYYVGKLMRQAKPDDVFTFVDLRTLQALWAHIVPHLGHRRAMWQWILDQWAEPSDDASAS